MALFTEDITLDYGEGWLALVLTGTSIYVSAIRGSTKAKLLYRFGLESGSKGTYLEVGDSLAVSETVYVKSEDYANMPTTITVTKD